MGRAIPHLSAKRARTITKELAVKTYKISHWGDFLHINELEWLLLFLRGWTGTSTENQTTWNMDYSRR